jgi:hypothetical protein
MRYERTMNVMVANTKPFLFAKLYNTCSTSDMIKCCDCSDIMRLHTSMNSLHKSGQMAHRAATLQLHNRCEFKVLLAATYYCSIIITLLGRMKQKSML